MKKSLLFISCFLFCFLFELQAQLGCCDLAAGPCVSNVTEADCNTQGGFWWGTGGACDDTTGGCAHGCCEVPLLNFCSGFTTQTDCINNNPPGTFWTYTGGGCDNPTPPCLNALPVELVGFSSKKSVKSIDLIWITAAETNTDGFEVQISFDGIKWEKLGFINGNGTSTSLNTYNFQVETKDLNIGLNYFRIKQIDFDASFEYSAIISEAWIGNNGKLVLTPNPVKDHLSIFLPELTIESENISYQLLNIFGKEIRNGLLNNNSQILDISNLESGSYFFLVKSGKNSYTARFIKI